MDEDKEGKLQRNFFEKNRKRPLIESSETKPNSSIASEKVAETNSEEEKLFCSFCSLNLSNKHDAKLHYIGVKHKKALARDETRRNLESRSVFLFGSNHLTKTSTNEYFNANFGPVAEVKMNESRHTCAIVEFADEETAQKVIAAKKHEINGFWFGVKPRRIPIETNTKSNIDEKSIEPKIRFNSAIFGHKLDNFNVENVEDLIKLHEILKLNAEDMTQRNLACKNLWETFKSYVAGDFSIVIYGSSVNCLGWKDSDVDMSLIFHHTSSSNEHQIRPVDVLKEAKLDEFLAENARLTYAELKSLSSAEFIRLLKKILITNRKVKNASVIDGIRCPLIQFTYDFGVYNCELSFENRLALNNSDWLKFLCTKFAFLPVMSSILRFWAVKNGLLAKSRSSFNGYTLVLMLITFLQTKRLLPTLEDLRRTSIADETNFIDGWNCNWNGSIVCKLEENKSWIELLIEFFNMIDEKTLRLTVFVPRIGQILNMERFLNEHCNNDDADHRSLFTFSELNVQDPFVLNHNIAAKIAPKHVIALKNGAKMISSTCSCEENFAKAFSSDNVDVPLSNAEHMIPFQSKLADGVSTYSFDLTPSVDEINRLGRVWLINFASKWLNETKMAIEKILTDVLFIELTPISNELTSNGDSPNAKRAKIETRTIIESSANFSELASNDDDSSPCMVKRAKIETKTIDKFECSTNFSVWNGRKRFHHEKPNEIEQNSFEIEKEISSKVMEDEKNSLVQSPLNFILTVERTSNDNLSAIKLNVSCRDQNQFGRFTTFCNFFRSTLRKIYRF